MLRKLSGLHGVLSGSLDDFRFHQPGWTPLRENLIGNAASFFGRARGRLHLGLRGQILLLGVAGVLVVGAIYLAGRQVEEHSQREAQRFASAGVR